MRPETFVRASLLVVAAGALALAAADSACAQGYPARTVRLIVPFVAAQVQSTADIVRSAGIAPQ